MVVLANCNLIDCVSPAVRAGMTITVDDGRIVSVTPDDDPAVPPERGRHEVIDLQGAYLLPGLWDVHIHPEYLPPKKPPRSGLDSSSFRSSRMT